MGALETTGGRYCALQHSCLSISRHIAPLGYLLDAVKHFILNHKPNDIKAIPDRAIAYVIRGVDVVL